MKYEYGEETFSCGDQFRNLNQHHSEDRRKGQFSFASVPELALVFVPVSMDWLRASSLLTALACLSVFPRVVQSVALSRSRGAEVATHVIDLKRTPGGTSRGGSSASRDEIRNRLSAFRRSLLKDFGVINSGLKGTVTTTLEPQQSCSIRNPDDIQRMLPGRFLSEDDLIMQVVPAGRSWVQSNIRGSAFVSRRRVVTGTGGQTDERRRPEHQAAFDFKPGASEFLEQNGGFCGSCLTEIGYEIMDQVVDFMGQNHTVINFKNAYQFIPSGRCLIVNSTLEIHLCCTTSIRSFTRNENSPCGVVGSKCRQVMRAHWSLVWTAGTGVNLVAHEVPSHCECLNLGTNRRVPLRSAFHVNDRATTSTRKSEFRLAGMRMANVHSEGSPNRNTHFSTVPNPSAMPYSTSTTSTTTTFTSVLSSPPTTTASTDVTLADAAEKTSPLLNNLTRDEE